MRRDEEYDSETPYVVVEEQGGGFTTFLWGLAIGAGLALVLAPQSGQETRQKLRRQAGRMRDVAQDAAGGLADSMAGGYQQAKRTVEQKIDTARRAIEIRKEQASQAIKAGREAAQQARDDLEARIAESKAQYQTQVTSGRTSRRAATSDAPAGPADTSGSTGI